MRFVRFPNLSLTRAHAHARHCSAGLSFDRGKGRMRIAITFCDQTEHKRHGDEPGYTYLGGCKAESLPHFIEFETPALANHECLFGVHSCTAAAESCAAARDFPGGSCLWRCRTRAER
jgi:hypothetical protein